MATFIFVLDILLRMDQRIHYLKGGSIAMILEPNWDQLLENFLLQNNIRQVINLL